MLISATGGFSVLLFGMPVVTLFSQGFSYFQDLLLGFFFSVTNQESLILIITWTGIGYRMFCWSATLLLEDTLFNCKLGKKSSSQVANLVFKAVRSRTSVPLWVRLCSLASVASSSAFKHVSAHFFKSSDATAVLLAWFNLVQNDFNIAAQLGAYRLCWLTLSCIDHSHPGPMQIATYVLYTYSY